MTYKQLPDIMYSEIYPTPVAEPNIVLYNHSLCTQLDLDETWYDADLLAGNQLPPQSTPIAQAYLGHQFGHLTMLGDGRAILLDEVITASGNRFDIQLKGAGKTPYSRGGDGRAALGPMLREYLISEAMHALHIPTSRSLAVVTTGETVQRERPLTGAILARVASSHLRVGTFQYAAHQAVIKPVADYTIDRHYPACRSADDRYACLLESVVQKQAELIAQWQSVGFIHGVMNTDNMALSGETIDYGPCAFMDTYRADQVFSSIDHAGRYRYSGQPFIAKWNLARLAETMLSLIDPDEDKALARAGQILDQFDFHFKQHWLKLFRKKLGLRQYQIGDSQWIDDFLLLLEQEQLDFTNAFVHLMDHPDAPLFSSEEGITWQMNWRQRINYPDDWDIARQIMIQVNPRVIPRNHRLEQAIQSAEAGDMSEFNELLAVVQTPFAEQVDQTWTQPPDPSQSFVSYCGT